MFDWFCKLPYGFQFFLGFIGVAAILTVIILIMYFFTDLYWNYVNKQKKYFLYSHLCYDNFMKEYWKYREKMSNCRIEADKCKRLINDKLNTLKNYIHPVTKIETLSEIFDKVQTCNRAVGGYFTSEEERMLVLNFDSTVEFYNTAAISQSKYSALLQQINLLRTTCIKLLDDLYSLNVQLHDFVNDNYQDALNELMENLPKSKLIKNYYSECLTDMRSIYKNYIIDFDFDKIKNNIYY